MLSCKDAIRLHSHAQDRQLRWVERTGLRLHLMICNGCREFTRQLALIRHACRHIDESPGMQASHPALTADAKARILKEMAAKPDPDSTR